MTTLPSFLAASTTSFQSSARASEDVRARPTEHAMSTRFENSITPSRFLFLDFDDDILLLDRDRKSLGLQKLVHQFGAVLHPDIEAFDLGAQRIAKGFSGPDVEFPAMPRATQHFALAAVLI